MNNAKSERQKYLFERAAIPKAIAVLSVPTVISQLITVIYNLADTYFVGTLDDPYQLSAINVCLPLMLIFTALANLFGIGGSGVVSRALGRGEREEAKKVTSFCIYGGVAVTLVYCAVVFFCSSYILPLMGSDEYTHDFAYNYMLWTIVIGGIFTTLNPLLAHLVRTEGSSFHAGLGMSLGAILNIILDPIMINGFGLGIVGAAIATLLGNLSACIYFVVFIILRKNNTVISLRPRKISMRRAYEVLITGLPSFFTSMLSSVSNSVVNNLITSYDTIALAGVGIAKKINLTAFAVTQGITQGILPLIGYNHAQKNKRRVSGIITFAGALAGIISLALMFFSLSAPELLVGLFINDAATVTYGSTFLKIICLAMPTSAFIFLAITYFQATGEKRFPLILSLLRKGSLDLIFMLLFNSIMGMNGILWATPAAELTASIVTVAMLLIYRKRSKTNIQNQ